MLIDTMTIGGSIAASALLVAAIIKRQDWLRDFIIGSVAIWFLISNVMLAAYPQPPGGQEPCMIAVESRGSMHFHENLPATLNAFIGHISIFGTI